MRRCHPGIQERTKELNEKVTISFFFLNDSFFSKGTERNEEQGEIQAFTFSSFYIYYIYIYIYIYIFFFFFLAPSIQTQHREGKIKTGNRGAKARRQKEKRRAKVSRGQWQVEHTHPPRIATTSPLSALSIPA